MAIASPARALPVSLDAYDSAGHHTGMLQNPNPQSISLCARANSGKLLPKVWRGSVYRLPADQNYNVVLHGLDTGTFTFEITPVSVEFPGTPITFADVPVTASSTATKISLVQIPASTFSRFRYKRRRQI